jgi:predicted membrane protein
MQIQIGIRTKNAKDKIDILFIRSALIFLAIVMKIVFEKLAVLIVALFNVC